MAREHNFPTKEWTVTLAIGDDVITEDVLAATKHAAAAAGETMYRGSKAVSVSRAWPVAGRCFRCKAIVFNDDRPELLPGGRLVCADC